MYMCVTLTCIVEVFQFASCLAWACRWGWMERCTCWSSKSWTWIRVESPATTRLDSYKESGFPTLSPDLTPWSAVHPTFQSPSPLRLICWPRQRWSVSPRCDFLSVSAFWPRRSDSGRRFCQFCCWKSSTLQSFPSLSKTTIISFGFESGFGRNTLKCSIPDGGQVWVFNVEDPDIFQSSKSEWRQLVKVQVGQFQHSHLKKGCVEWMVFILCQCVITCSKPLKASASRVWTPAGK